MGCTCGPDAVIVVASAATAVDEALRNATPRSLNPEMYMPKINAQFSDVPDPAMVADGPENALRLEVNMLIPTDHKILSDCSPLASSRSSSQTYSFQFLFNAKSNRHIQFQHRAEE